MIDKNKSYRTRDGDPVIIYTTTACDGDYTVHGAIIQKNGNHTIKKWASCGTFNISTARKSLLDLMEVPKIITKYLSLTDIGAVHAWNTEEERDEEETFCRISTAEVNFEVTCDRS